MMMMTMMTLGRVTDCVLYCIVADIAGKLASLIFEVMNL